MICGRAVDMNGYKQNRYGFLGSQEFWGSRIEDQRVHVARSIQLRGKGKALTCRNMVGDFTACMNGCFFFLLKKRSYFYGQFIEP